MTKTVFHNVTIFDGTGSDPYTGSVLIQDDRIASIVRGDQEIDAPDARVFDGRGRFLMPGMTEAHTHFSWNDQPRCRPSSSCPPRSTSSGVCASQSGTSTWDGPLPLVLPRLSLGLTSSCATPSTRGVPWSALSGRQPGNHHHRRSRRQHPAAPAV
jgi:predicted amidohydrolase